MATKGLPTTLEGWKNLVKPRSGAAARERQRQPELPLTQPPAPLATPYRHYDDDRLMLLGLRTGAEYIRAAWRQNDLLMPVWSAPLNWGYLAPSVKMDRRQLTIFAEGCRRGTRIAWTVYEHLGGKSGDKLVSALLRFGLEA